MGVWNHIFLEAYCMYSWLSKKKYKMVTWEGLNKKEKLKPDKVSVCINKDYIPKSKRPKWCKEKNKERTPQFNCLCDGEKDGMCPFFGFCEVDNKQKKYFNRAWNQLCKAEEKELEKKEKRGDKNL